MASSGDEVRVFRGGAPFRAWSSVLRLVRDDGIRLLGALTGRKGQRRRSRPSHSACFEASLFIFRRTLQRQFEDTPTQLLVSVFSISRTSSDVFPKGAKKAGRHHIHTRNRSITLHTHCHKPISTGRWGWKGSSRPFRHKLIFQKSFFRPVLSVVLQSLLPFQMILFLRVLLIRAEPMMNVSGVLNAVLWVWYKMYEQSFICECNSSITTPA